MKREIIQTLDGSTTIHLTDWDECYHSKHGAIQEAQHVFIKNGLALFPDQKVALLEIGFGTGLNAFITVLESEKRNQIIDYVGVEAYPVAAEEVLQMNYVAELNANDQLEIFQKMHESNWEEKTVLTSHFTLTKREQFFENIDDEDCYDLIYFDAFGYRVQPELWSTAVFEKMYKALRVGGVLVTYAARGVVKRSMIEVGFTVEKLAGPPGKREMFRAFKK
ncbi:tRNA (5-methylaminomethyl-2-thiouridine)(34)-methyltransferase MnmD [Flavobacterium turcicum]|uniref:tRNA (5-methylaminomethyl-2-thiouridine)(34)-methyltransferase MnmD n=1 Tax=Flavobacterium turcicum TaxID=2764718 RepID=A0ABR7JFU1_9FLAO|nr:tRNA (5-methylaminomethyl-2-thiouridine)(34)-methyltransferase MnmD [Flavobacterium turcicum]MBC5863369.1 tRNA (5-methylaminomethyl-2-thiouridine)(34)-methyltransferase MnmD [Flavobacterium turcicum]NHL02101.1 tRNA (5-methylaminomethyl-2-thiouridine)(34)-methyltransferase MnmD [Flavobacterium turcicum]